MKYKCPLCGSALSEAHYHRVITRKEKTEKVQKGELDRLNRRAANAEAAAEAAKKKEKELRRKAKESLKSAKREAALAERRKTETRDKRMMARIKKLEEEKKMLQKHTSPQEIGLADEMVLVQRLKKEFPQDRVQHTGKGGDVLHGVMLGEDEAGCIVYECKHTDRISSDHIAQTALAKKTRQAYFGILVTTGTRRGFSGLDQDSGILVVAPAGVLTLARICRDSLITMAKQRLDAAAKAAAAKRLMDYITDPICRTPIEEAIMCTERARRNLNNEAARHLYEWGERSKLYQTIQCDISSVRTNIDRVLAGNEPLKLGRPVFEPLALPLKQK